MVATRFTSISIFSLLLLGIFSCSDGATNSGPTRPVLTGTGGGSAGGSPGSGGTPNSGGAKASGGSAMGGLGGNVGSGGTMSSTGGVANTGGAAGSVMCSSGVTVPDLTNCDAAKVAAFFKAGRKCEGCHFQPDDPNDLTMNKLHEFDTEVGLNVLIGRMTMRAQLVNCAVKTLVEPGNAEGSLLYLKLKGTPPVGCGIQMPKPEGARPQCTLTAAELKCVADWINGLPSGGAGGAGGATN